VTFSAGFNLSLDSLIFPNCVKKFYFLRIVSLRATALTGLIEFDNTEAKYQQFPYPDSLKYEVSKGSS
jgi:hypothetical protein